LLTWHLDVFLQRRAEGDPTEDPEQEAQQAHAGVRRRGIRGAGLGISPIFIQLINYIPQMQLGLCSYSFVSILVVVVFFCFPSKMGNVFGWPDAHAVP